MGTGYNIWLNQSLVAFIISHGMLNLASVL